MSGATKKRLREFRAPDEIGAESRAWGVVRSAYLDRQATVARRPRWRLAIVPAVVVIMGALALSPAGASVRRLITRALGEQHAAPALFALPSPGRILLSGPGGTWIAAADGSTRLLGSWSQASWSPHGLFVAVVARDRLAAVDPHGTVRWALARTAVSDPRWYSPSGYRVAYLSAGRLRVVDGDGTGDRLLATGVAHVAPAWRPGEPDGPYELAYVTARGELVVRDAAAAGFCGQPRRGRDRTSSRGRPTAGACSRCLRTGPGSTPRTAAGRSRSPCRPARRRATGAVPDGRRLALYLGGKQVVVTGSTHPAMRQVLGVGGVQQLSWSPDGRWLLVSLPAANQGRSSASPALRALRPCHGSSSSSPMAPPTGSRSSRVGAAPLKGRPDDEVEPPRRR